MQRPGQTYNSQEKKLVLPKLSKKGVCQRPCIGTSARTARIVLTCRSASNIACNVGVAFCLSLNGTELGMEWGCQCGGEHAEHVADVFKLTKRAIAFFAAIRQVYTTRML